MNILRTERQRRKGERKSIVFHPVRRGFLSGYDLRERFSRLLTWPPGQRYSPAMDRRVNSAPRAGIQYLKLHEQGKVELRGPFLVPGVGGRMVTTKEITQEEIEVFASNDPAIKSGMLISEIRPWMTAMEHD